MKKKLNISSSYLFCTINMACAQFVSEQIKIALDFQHNDKYTQIPDGRGFKSCYHPKFCVNFNWGSD